MKNKFEALTAFQSWPEDWQRLCAEYWAENDKPKVDAMTSSAGYKKASNMTCQEREQLSMCLDFCDKNQSAAAKRFCRLNPAFKESNIRSHIQSNVAKNHGKYRVE